MRQRKKVWSICLVIALVFSSIFTWNEPALTAYASETKTEKIVVYVAAQGKSLDGTNGSLTLRLPLDFHNSLHHSPLRLIFLSNFKILLVIVCHCVV